MKKIMLIAAIIFISNYIAAEGFSAAVKTKSISSGYYEDGKFTPSNNTFQAVYIIDEPKSEIRLDEVIENNREGRQEKGAIYDITNTVISSGISSLNVSANKKGQNIITASRENSDSSETLVIGGNFYQFLRAADGRFYLEYGSVEKHPDVNEKLK